MSSIEIRMDLVGDKDIERLLRGWPPASRNRIMRPGISKASRLIARKAKSLAPVDSGLLRKSIGVRVRNYKEGNVVGVVGPRHGFKKPVVRDSGKSKIITKKNVEKYHDTSNKVVLRNPVKYAHLVEGGTAPHALGKGSSRFVRQQSWGVVQLASGQKVRRRVNVAVRAGEQRGRRHPGAKPKPFMGPAFRQSAPMARQIVRVEAGRAVRKEAMRLVRRRGFAA